MDKSFGRDSVLPLLALDLIVPASVSHTARTPTCRIVPEEKNKHSWMLVDGLDPKNAVVRFASLKSTSFLLSLQNMCAWV